MSQNNGEAADLVFKYRGMQLTLVYVDGTKGWKLSKLK